MLTWFSGVVTSGGTGGGEFEVLDSSYRTIARVRAGNGYQADLHDYDYMHSNAIGLDTDGNLLLSARHMSMI